MEDTNKPETLIRYGEPGKYDQAPYGTQCTVSKGKHFEIYVQTSKDEDDPVWEFVGCFPNESTENINIDEGGK